MFEKSVKFIAFLLILGLMFTLAGCGGAKENPKELAKQEPNKPEYTIKLGHSDKPVKEAIIHITALKFKELVEKESNGRIQVEIYPANQLGDQTEQVKNVQLGTQEMFQGSVGNLAQSAPALCYLSLPYIFTGKDDARNTLDAMWDKNAKWAVEGAGIRPLIWSDAGFRNLTTAKKPVNTLADLKGQRIRIPPNPVFVECFKAFGIEPVTLAWSETFNALQQGVVDGQENCYSAVQTEHFYETQKFATNIEWLYTISHFSISEKFFQSLPKDLQDVVIRAGKETTAWERQEMDKMEKEIEAFLKEKGVKFLGKPTDFDKWVEAGRSIWPQFYEKIGSGDKAKGEEVIKQVMETKKK